MEEIRDNIVLEQFQGTLSDKVRVFVKERGPEKNEDATTWQEARMKGTGSCKNSYLYYISLQGRSTKGEARMKGTGSFKNSYLYYISLQGRSTKEEARMKGLEAARIVTFIVEGETMWGILHRN